MALRDIVGKYIPVVKRRPSLTKQQAMAISPVHNTSITWTKIDGGEILLKIPKRSDRLGKIIGRIFRIPDYKEILLDEVGAGVWEMCDGKKSIGQIIDETSKMFKLNKRESEVSVTTYIKMLAERRLVGLLQRGGKLRHERR
ncbi:MAG: PqqD family protein [Armatimonadota bacterium]|nr:PqqD family protein [Armatimonadota bacterium]